MPLGGVLKRLPDKKKTIPEFERGWREKYQKIRNGRESALGGVITGEISGIVAIDCDNAETWDIFAKLDSSNKFLFMSRGKDAGTLIYEYDKLFSHSFSIHRNGLSLDFYSSNGFVYLPTEKNKTKITLGEPLPPILKLPENTKTLLTHLYVTSQSPLSPKKESNQTGILHPLIQHFIEGNGKYLPGLFKVITPQKYRNHPDYLRNGHLRPDSIEDGEGSNYLSRVSAVLGADASIDVEMYIASMSMINSLFSNPMDEDRLDKTILSRMIEGKAKIGGEVVWKYNENWKKNRTIFRTKDESTIECVYDDNMQSYYVVDVSKENYKSFRKPNDLTQFLQVTTKYNKTTKELVHSLPLVDTIVQPNKDFGFHDTESNKRDLNIFSSTPALKIFYNPQSYKNLYKKPHTILQFLESLVPDKEMHDYLLRFLKTKLLTLEYSPVVLYFLGVPGSGKGLFVRIIEKMFGLVPAPSVAEFLDKFNKWVVGAYFVELDEYGDSATSMKDRKELLGKLQSLTGKQKVDVREMHMNSYRYEHNITFIMTSNKNPLILLDDDRRIALFNTPNILAAQEWVIDIDKTFHEIIDEVNDFCFYLATEVVPLPLNEYVSPPALHGKFELIAESMPAASMIAYCLKNKNIDYLVRELEDYGFADSAQFLEQGSIYFSQLEEFYMEMTENRGNRRALLRTIRERGNVTMTRSGEGNSDFTITGFLDI